MNSKHLRQNLMKYQSQLMIHLNSRPYAGLDQGFIKFLEAKIEELKIEISGGSNALECNRTYRKAA